MQDLYFKNHEAKLIFGLAELGGKQQLDFLRINYGHYSNKKLAEKWYTETKEKIAEIWYSNIKDVLVNSNLMKDVALENLEKLYRGMK